VTTSFAANGSLAELASTGCGTCVSTGHLAVSRLGQRSDADLAWETDLLPHLHREGMPVPAPIPTTDGRHFVDGLVVMTYAEGGPPETEADWRRVAGTLRQLHRLTQGWPQHPGWRSSTDLLHAETGTCGARLLDLAWTAWRAGIIPE
jgi:Ser/Thr protein kinase RdoA (MazF antagonist)